MSQVIDAMTVSLRSLRYYVLDGTETIMDRRVAYQQAHDKIVPPLVNINKNRMS